MLVNTQQARKFFKGAEYPQKKPKKDTKKSQKKSRPPRIDPVKSFLETFRQCED